MERICGEPLTRQNGQRATCAEPHGSEHDHSDPGPTVRRLRAERDTLLRNRPYESDAGRIQLDATRAERDNLRRSVDSLCGDVNRLRGERDGLRLVVLELIASVGKASDHAERIMGQIESKGSD
jgi:hypothetical protein